MSHLLAPTHGSPGDDGLASGLSSLTRAVRQILLGAGGVSFTDEANSNMPVWTLCIFRTGLKYIPFYTLNAELSFRMFAFGMSKHGCDQDEVENVLNSNRDPFCSHLRCRPQCPIENYPFSKHGGA